MQRPDATTTDRGGGRYAAFTFVDRIVALAPGAAAKGTFHIPPHSGAFPPSLLAEATGQLAAWVAVSRLDFRLRPVAGIAHETIYAGCPRPGDTLDTEISIDSCEDDAVAYQGWARVGGETVLELRDCVGPMLPLEDFDDPAAMRAFFRTLCGEGARPGRFPGVSLVALHDLEHDEGRFASARLDVPTDAAFFADHFPRRPVFPGTLLLDRMTSLASRVAGEAAHGGIVRLSRVGDVKLRAFTDPGARLELRATIDDVTPHAIAASIDARVEGQRRPVGAARAEFEVQR